MNKIAIALCFVFLGFACVSFAAGKDDAITAKEQTMWDLIKQRDFKTFGSNIAEDVIEIDPDGTVYTGKTALMQNLEKFQLQTFTLSDIRVQWIDDDAALVAYKANINGTTEGQTVPSDYSCSTVWAKKGGNWMVRFHQETVIAPMGAAKQ